MGRRIRKGDLVQVIAGADRGKRGKVIGVDAKAGRVRVESVRPEGRREMSPADYARGADLRPGHVLRPLPEFAPGGR